MIGIRIFFDGPFRKPARCRLLFFGAAGIGTTGIGTTGIGTTGIGTAGPGVTRDCASCRIEALTDTGARGP
ncbi:hypothetical protein EZV77_30020 [Burkholderia thailandensis]|nr:hypothetical protein EZV77_30020 [Burkholderia thailandensis]